MPRIANDLSDKQFGSWTVLERAEVPAKGPHWRCRCKCGKIAIVLGASLIAETSTRCKRCAAAAASERHTRDLAGQTIEGWLVLKRESGIGEGHVKWLCQCKNCSRKKTVAGSEIGKRSTKCKTCAAKNRRSDLAGKTYGRWTVVARATGKDLWHCECSGCGRKKIINGASIRCHGSKGCATCHYNDNVIDLTGKQFGKLKVLSRAKSKPSKHGGSARWLCQCECGRRTEVNRSNLLMREKTGGGCKFCNAGRFIAGPGRLRLGNVTNAAPPAVDATKITTPAKANRGGRPTDDDVARRKREMLKAWDDGKYKSKAEAARAHNFHRPDASKWIKEHEQEKA